MSKLTRLLRQAHAIEIGAYNAYEGHWRNIKPIDRWERGRVKIIQVEELLHKEMLERMLKEVGGKPSRAQDALLWIIGKSISTACYVMGYKAAMWGAKIMEKMGGLCYKQLAKVARDEGYPAMAVDLDYMQRAEEEHEEFFKTCLKLQCTCRYLRYLNGSVSREVNVFCRAEHKF